MSADYAGQWVTAGALARGTFRLGLTKAGIRFTESKSLTKSVFIIQEPREVYDRLLRAIHDIPEEPA